MNDIRVYPLDRDEAEMAGRFLLPEAVAALKKDLPVTVLVAVEDGRAVGALAGAIDGEVFELCSLYVEPGCRRRGAGTALIQRLSELVDEDETAIRAQFTPVDEEGEALRSFLRKMGFYEDAPLYPRYYIGYLEDIQLGGTGSRIKGGVPILSFAETDEKLLKSADRKGFREGWPMPDGGLAGEDADRRLSLCVVKDKEIQAYVTAADRKDGLVEITSMWSRLENPREAHYMFSQFVENLRERYGPQTRVAVLATDSFEDRMIDRFFSYRELCSCRMVRSRAT